MKIRMGFVSNSSSSSFLIQRKYISESQLEQIVNHDDEAGDDEWEITVTDTIVRGFTIMDNFDMAEFLEKIGVDSDHILWDDAADNFPGDEECLES